MFWYKFSLKFGSTVDFYLKYGKSIESKREILSMTLSKNESLNATRESRVSVILFRRRENQTKELALAAQNVNYLFLFSDRKFDVVQTKFNLLFNKQ